MGEPVAGGDDDANVDEDRQRAAAAGGAAPPPRQQAASSGLASAGVSGPSPGAMSSGSAGGIEIELLTYQAVERLVGAVAQACEGTAGKILLVTPSDLMQAAGARLAYLLLSDLTERMSRLYELKSGRESATEAGAAPDPVAALGAVVKLGQDIVTTVGITEARTGHSVAVDERGVAVLAARALSKCGLKSVVLAEPGAWSDPAAAKGVLAKAQAAALALRQLGDKGGEEAGALLDRYRELLDQAAAAGPALVAGFATLAAMSEEDAKVLTIRVLTAGGTIWEKRHIGTLLGLSDPFSFSAGAVISYSFVNARTGEIISADTLYDWTGRNSVPRETRLASLTNVPRVSKTDPPRSDRATFPSGAAGK
ncbi:MAG TPA: hypothetical protein VGB57_03300 [Allosphingosinicella sp.]